MSRISNFILILIFVFFFESCSSDSYRFSKEAVQMADSLCDCFTKLRMTGYSEKYPLEVRDSCFAYMDNEYVCPICVYVYRSGNSLGLKPHQRDSIDLIYLEMLVLVDSLCRDDPSRGEPVKMIDLKNRMEDLVP